MHEASIAASIITTVRKELQSRHLNRPVQTIVFKAGKLNAIIPESLMFHFDVLKKDEALLENATLEVRENPLVAHCDTCGKSIELHEPLFLCPDCGGSVTPEPPEAGREMYVDSLVIQDEPPEPPRRT